MMAAKTCLTLKMQLDYTKDKEENEEEAQINENNRTTNTRQGLRKRRDGGLFLARNGDLAII